MSKYIRPSDVMPKYPSGTNSTMFTECCGCAICDSELNCPVCKNPVIGHDEPTDYKRGRKRWESATSAWPKHLKQQK